MDGKSVPPRLVLVQVERPAGHVVYRRQAEDWGGCPVRVVCAWCGRLISGPLTPSVMISHGLCEKCKTKLLKEAGL
jgi:hypothetical protein